MGQTPVDSRDSRPTCPHERDEGDWSPVARPTVPDMKTGRTAPEPVMSDVVRQRLAVLLAEIPARRAVAEPEDYFQVEADPDDDAAVEGGSRPEPARPAGAGESSSVQQALADVWSFTREHLAAVAVILLTGCLWAGYSVLQASSVPVALAVPTVVGSPTPTPSPTPVVKVHLLGAVAHPGVVTVAEGSRVADALEAAGGLAEGADPGELNLAAIVVDGSQIVIGTRRKPLGEVRTGGGSAAGEVRVNLNTATLAQLDTLPGVGPVTAQKIIDWRDAHGRFSTIEELQEVDGIGPKSYADLSSRVRV